MTSKAETLEAIQSALGPYVRSQDEISHIRRVLALHLDSCLKDASAVGPLSLIEPTKPASTSASRGLQREYLEALNANIRAREEYKACRRETRQPQKASSAAEVPRADHLQERLSTINLQRKHDRLQAVHRHLDMLKKKPAALQDFLDPTEVFRDSSPLPDVPKDVVTALTLNDTPAITHLKDLNDQQEKHVLRAKLLLKREEQLLEQVRQRSSVAPGAVTKSAKFEALNVARGELISWIEAELGKAGDGTGADDDRDPAAGSHRTSDTVRLDEQLAAIRAKYARYIEARKALLQLVSQPSKPVIKPLIEAKKPAIASACVPTPSTHLLSPYLEQLLAIAHEQKGLITQKSHISIMIAKQLKETCQALDHLAEESQLIPAHPIPGTSRRKPAVFGDAMSASETLDASNRVKPWVCAADLAKIATFEAVAERIDEAQIALEGSIRTIGETDQLLGSHPGQQNRDGDEVGEVLVEDDIWLAESRPAGSRKHVSRKRAKSRAVGDVWDVLDGNLGLLRSEGGVP